MSNDDPSVIAASITCPFPEVFVSQKAETIPNARSIPPPPKSPIKLSGRTGGESFLPIAARAPDKEI